MKEVYSANKPVDIHYRISHGDDAASEIVRVADEIGADLVVMGTHGRTGLRRLLYGSVAASVVAGSHCSVLALRAGHCERTADAIQVILHPTDFSETSEAALKVARSLAREHGAKLIILHVVPLDPTMQGRMAAELDTGENQNALDAIRKRIDGDDLKYPVETRLVRGLEAEEILREAQDFASDLIVMGTHGRTGLGRLLTGNTAQSVLPQAECPILIVKSSRLTPSSAPDRVATVAQASSQRPLPTRT